MSEARGSSEGEGELAGRVGGERPRRPDPRLALVRLALVGAAIFGAWHLFPSLRRVDVAVEVASLERACAERLHVRLGRSSDRVDHALRVDLDTPGLLPWKVRLTPGEHRLEGEVRCASGRVARYGPHVFEVKGPSFLALAGSGAQASLSVPVAGLCPCPRGGRR